MIFLLLRENVIGEKHLIEADQVIIVFLLPLNFLLQLVDGFTFIGRFILLLYTY